MGTHPIFESDFDCLTDMKWSFQLEIDNQPTIDLVVGREHFFDGQLNLITRTEALAQRASLLVTVSDPALCKKPSLAIRSIGKYVLTYQGASHRKFFFSPLKWRPVFGQRQAGHGETIGQSGKTRLLQRVQAI